jgi:hypothetical protein
MFISAQTLGRAGRIPAARSLESIDFKPLCSKNGQKLQMTRGGSREMNLKEVSKENALSRLRSQTDRPKLCGPLGLYNSLLGALIEQRDFTASRVASRVASFAGMRNHFTGRIRFF